MLISILFGFVFLALAFYTVLPVSWGLQWTEEFLITVKGGVPILLAFIGLLCILVGLLVLKDKIEASKEEKKIKNSSVESDNSE